LWLYIDKRWLRWLFLQKLCFFLLVASDNAKKKMDKELLFVFLVVFFFLFLFD
jgi:hypothetical protein